LIAVRPVPVRVEVNVAVPRPVVLRFNVVRALSPKEATVKPPVAVPVFMLAVKLVAVVVVGVTVVNAVLLLVSVMVNPPVVVVVAAIVPMVATGTAELPVMFRVLNEVPPKNVAASVLPTVALSLTVAVASAELVMLVAVKVALLALVSFNVTLVRPLPVKAGIVNVPLPLPAVI